MICAIPSCRNTGRHPIWMRIDGVMKRVRVCRGHWDEAVEKRGGKT